MYTLWIYSFTSFEHHRKFSKPLGIMVLLIALGKATLCILNKTSPERVRYGRWKLLWCYFISIYCARRLTTALGIPLISVLGFLWVVRSVEQQILIHCCIVCNIYRWCIWFYCSKIAIIERLIRISHSFAVNYCSVHGSKLC